MKDKFFVKVTTDTYYLIDKGVNGWTEKEIIEEWFKNYPLSRSHASRDYCKIGGSERLKEAVIISEAEWKKIHEAKQK